MTAQLKIGAVLSYASIGFSIIAGLIYTPWMIEKLGQSDFGIYTLVNSVINLFLLDFGLSSAISRFLAKYRASGEIENSRRFLSAAYKIFIVIDIVLVSIFIILFFNIEHIYINLSEGELLKFKLVYIIAAVYSVISFPCVTYKGILIAYEKFISLKVAELIQRVGAVVLTMITLTLGGKLLSVVISNIIFGIISYIIKYFYVKQCIEIKFVNNTKHEYINIFQFSMWSTIWGIAERLVFNITPTIIGITVPAASVAIAIFGIITTIEGYFYTITTAINGMFLSKIMRIVQTDSEKEELTSLAINVGRFQFVINGLILVGFLFVGKEFILLWMGEEFALAYQGVIFVIIPGLFYNPLQIANTTIVAKNLIKYQAYIHLAIGICNVIMGFILSKEYGVIGAAMSIGFALSLRVVLTIILIRKKLDLDIQRYFKQCYIRMIIPLIATMIVCGTFIDKIYATTWTMLVVKSGVVMMVYFIALFVLGINYNERLLIVKELFGKKYDR